MIRMKYWGAFFLIGVFFSFGVVTAQTISVSNVVVNPEGTGTMKLVLDEAPHGLLGYKINLVIPDSSVAQVSAVTYPSGFNLFDTNKTPFTTGIIKAMDLYGTFVPDGSHDITLATITVRGISSGSTVLHPTVMLIQDLNGDNFSPSPKIIDGTITVSGSSSTLAVTGIPVQIDGAAGFPTDPNKDGLYEDVNGDGVIDHNDVTCFFNNFDWIAQNEPVSAFDFNKDKRIDFDDVVILNQNLQQV